MRKFIETRLSVPANKFIGFDDVWDFFVKTNLWDYIKTVTVNNLCI
jgi:hypothetical protein